MISTKFGFIIGGGIIFIFLTAWEWFAHRPKNLEPTSNPSTSRVSSKKRIFSYRTNLISLLFNNVVQFILTLGSLYWVVETYSSGLLKWLNLSNLATWVISFFLYDFLIYIWHRINHQFNFFWQFHRCHHSDQDLNTSTGFRFHIGELILSIVFKALMIVIFGFSVEFIIFFEYITLYFAMFHHSDIKPWGESYLKYVLVMPVHHNTHHSPVRTHHDSNYGVVFSFWDRLFKTYDPHQPTTYGLNNGEKKVGEKDFIGMLKYGITPLHLITLVMVVGGIIFWVKSF